MSQVRATRGARTPPAALVALVATSMVGPACKTPSVTFEVNVPGDVAGQIAWFEIGVFPYGNCPPDAELAGGVPPDGSVARLAFKSTDPNPPALGTLAKNRYAFAAVARKADCSVVATGCSNVDVSSARDVSISLSDTPTAAGACLTGAVCDEARCVPGSDNGNPSVGAGCSLELMGAGPLEDPLGDATLLTAPAVAATDTGFVIAYRETDAASGSQRLTVIPIDAGGGRQPSQSAPLPGACPGLTAADATGLAFNGGTGLVALARPPCSTGADGGGSAGAVGIDLLGVDHAGTLKPYPFQAVSGAAVSLATSHALAATPSGFLLALTIDGQTFDAPIAGKAFSQAPSPFGNAAPQSAGWIAASQQGTALLALGTGATVPGEGGVPLDAGTGASTLRLNLAPAGADLAALPAATELPASWGAVAMVGRTALVASDSTDPSNPVSWQTFTVGSSTTGAAGGFTTASLGKVIYGDVTLHQDHAFFAVEVAAVTGTISLIALDKVTTKPVFLREVPFSSDARIPVGDLRDGLVSVAASDTRVAVVWGTARSLGTNDTVGGYAVFACTP